MLGNRRGSTILESALVFVPFVFLLIGTLDFGQFLYLHQTLTEQARGAARWGAMQQKALDDDLRGRIQNMAIYGQEAVPAQGRPVFGLTREMVHVSSTPADAQTGSYQVVVNIR